MAIVLPIILTLLFLVSWGLIGQNGLWNNALLLVNVVTSAFVSMNFFEPLARLLSGYLPSMAGYFDILLFWILFIVTYLILRKLTDLTSTIQIRFVPKLNLVGGLLLGAWTSWVFVCLVGFSLHMAPLAREPFFGGFKAEQPLLFGFSPDRLWLGFAQRSSLGLYARGGSESEPEEHVFDPNGEFMIKYAWRRTQIESPPDDKK